jgi:hypothetical protein
VRFLASLAVDALEDRVDARARDREAAVALTDDGA